MTVRFPVRQGERGAVAIMVALAMVVFIGLLGIVIDLGMLYIRKTELQNAADAAALAGAKRLDGTLAGVNAAVADAVAMAGFNATDFDRTEVSITDANIQFAPDPDGPWSSVADSQAQPLNKRFIKVDTTGILQGTRPTLFMRAISASNDETTATALAVAGAPICENLPMFVCAKLDGTAANNWGYTAGQSYRLLATNDSNDTTANIGYMDPVPPGAPGLVTGANEMRDILCKGKTFCITGPGTYTSLTQRAFGTMMAAVNTRFERPNNLPTKLTAEMCPPDANVKQYIFNSALDGMPRYWMDEPYDPELQAEDDNPESGKLGVHWAAVRPQGAPPVNGNYPQSGTPYTQPENSVFHQKPLKDLDYAQPGRRIITLGLATNCWDDANKPAIPGGGKPVNIAGFAQFLMMKEAESTGSRSVIYGEFIRLTASPPSSIPDIKLYR